MRLPARFSLRHMLAMGAGLTGALGGLASCGGEPKSGLGPVDVEVADVTVIPARTAISVGEVVLVRAEGRAASGQAVPVDVSWSVAGGSVVPVSDSEAHFSASTPGTYTVHAQESSAPTVQDSAAITVNVVVSPTVSLTVSPGSASLAAGGTRTFTVSAARQDGSTYVPSVVWSATGGSITGGGLYTAGGSAGTYRAIAVMSGGTLADTAAITITGPVLQSIAIAPAFIAMETGESRQFTVTGLWSNGTTTAPAVTYSATGGTITSGGMFTAGGAVGNYHVIAVLVGGTLADTADVQLYLPGSHPNEPPGLAMPYTIPAARANPFDQLPAKYPNGPGSFDLDQYGWLLEEGNFNHASIVNDAERGNAFQVAFPAGMGGGGSPFTAVAGGGHVYGLSASQAVKQIFLEFRVKLSSNWSDANLGTKLLFFWSTDPSDGQFYINLTDGEIPYLRGGVGIEHGGVGHQDILGPSRGRGVWVRYEYYIKLNTPGMANGILKCWVDGSLEINRSNVEFINNVANIDWLKLDMTYGGGLNPVPVDMNIRLDDWYVKVGP